MAQVTYHVSIAYHFFVMIIFFFLMGFPDSSSAEAVGNVCQSAECIDIADKIREYMDPSISPCNDFYKFVCNKFHVNKDKTLEPPIILKKTSSLARPSSLQQDSPLQKANKIHTLCMAQNVTSQHEVEVIRQVIQRIGGWPIVEGNEWHQKKWENVVTSLSQSGYYWGIFFENTFGISSEDSYIYILPVHFEKIEDIDDVAWVTTQLGVNSSNIAEVKETIRNVSDHFGNFKPNYVKYPFPRILTIAEMTVKWPSIDWMKFFAGYFANLTNVIINTNTNVSVITSEVDDVVNFIARTSKEQIMNYVISRIVVELRSYFPEILMRDRFSLRPSRLPPLSDHEIYCEAVNTYGTRGMKLSALGTSYINNKILDEFSNSSELMRHKMGELINQAHLDNQTLQKHRETLSKMTIEIFGQDRRTLKSLDKFNDLVLNDQDFGDTLWNVVKFHHNFNVERIWRMETPEPPSPTDRTTHRIKRTIRAHYNDALKRITIRMTSVALQSFQDGFPKYFSYGMVGSTIGHEMGHSVSQEEIFVLEGNWTSSNQAQRKVLSSKVNCFKRLYDTYVKELNATIMSAHSVREDVADHIGCKVAHSVYKDWLDANGPEPQLPNLNYTSMQMFWITYAYDWCDDVPELEWVNRDTEAHSPNRYRVNMPLSNIPAFSEAFKCQPGSRMNPVEKCSYW